MIVAVTVGDMFINIDKTDGANGDADFFLDFPMQGGKDPFPMLDLATRHDPQTVKRGDAAPGEEDALRGIDDTGHN